MTKLSQRLGQVAQTNQRKQLPPKTIPFGEYMPDQPDYANPGATIANNVIAKSNSYGPFRGLQARSDALDARCQGVTAGSSLGGAVSIYAGDATKLYNLAAELFTDISKAGGYNIAEDGTWEFAQFGNSIIATNFDDAVQVIAPGGAIFSDLITSTLKPTARHIAIVRDFVVLGNTNDAVEGAKPNRVQWSAINDSTDFDPDSGTQSDFNDIPEGGWCQGLVGGEYGLVFMEREIQRMTYVGSPLVFQFDRVERNRGTHIPGSIISLGRLTFYISEQGFFHFDGTTSTPIGVNKVDKFFASQFDTPYISRVSAAIDPINKTVLWGFPGTGSTAGNPNLFLIYNWSENKWSDANVNHQLLSRSLSQGITLDELDTVSTDIETGFGFSFDSRAFASSEFKLAAFDTANRYNYFDGNNLAATIETGEARHNPVGTFHVRSLRPLIDGGTITAAIAGRALPTAAVSFGSAASINALGECSVQNNSRFPRFRASIAAAGTWGHAQGVEVLGSPGGRW